MLLVSMGHPITDSIECSLFLASPLRCRSSTGTPRQRHQREAASATKEASKEAPPPPCCVIVALMTCSTCLLSVRLKGGNDAGYVVDHEIHLVCRLALHSTDSNKTNMRSIDIIELLKCVDAGDKESTYGMSNVETVRTMQARLRDGNQSRVQARLT